MVAMTVSGKPEFALRTLLRELEAARARLVQSQECPKEGETVLAAFSLSKDVRHLCKEAAACHDPIEADALIDKARNRLDDLQKLLGTH
jgi:hypothetical protein